MIFRRINNKNGGRMIGMLLVVLCALAAAFSGCSDGRGAEQISNEGAVVISEIMAQNSSVLSDEDGDCSDWIELHNAGNNTVSLEGWYLSDDMITPYKWAFPAVTMEPGEYLIVFASGKDRSDADGVLHTNFKLNSSEDAVLVCPKNQYTFVMSPGNGMVDVSYCRTTAEDGSEKFMWCSTPTPGGENSGTLYADMNEMPSPMTGVVISEYSSSNVSAVSDSQGNYYDWVELFNTTDADISMEAGCLSDDPENPEKWIIPDGVTIPAGGYLLIYLSGMDQVVDGEIHAGFGLSSSDDTLYLSDSALRVIDQISLERLGENVSAGISEDQVWRFFLTPTPGAQNGSDGCEDQSELKPLAGKLMISEVCGAEVEDFTGLPQKDWIELYNASSEAINLSGYSLSNNEAELTRFTFGDVTIGAGEYLVIYAPGDDAVAGEACFNVDAGGEDIFLSDPSQKIIDKFATGKLRIGVTSGRSGDGSDERLFFPEPTKGEVNGEGFASYAPVPEIVTKGGNVQSGSKVEIAVPEGCTVRYTTDGSDPDEGAEVYSQPITITENTTVIARAFSDDKVSSDTVFTTYLVDAPHDIPVFCISSDPEGFFSEESGIYFHKLIGQWPYFGSNHWNEWERKVNAEYYIDNSLELTFTSGVKIAGRYSRNQEKKSMQLKFRDVYGASTLVYPFFGEDSPSESKALVLRSGSQDVNGTMFTDEFCAELIDRYSDDLITMDWQPIALYINGEYWGLFYIREKINDDYLIANEGLDPDSLTMIDRIYTASRGSYDEISALRKDLQKRTMNRASSWEYGTSLVNIEGAIDMSIFSAYLDRHDCGNLDCYKSADTKWNWIAYDFDSALENSSQSDRGHEYIAKMDPLIRPFFRNDTFVEMYLARYAELMDTAFQPDNLISLLEEFSGLIESEMGRECERWGYMTYEQWEANVEEMRNVIRARNEKVLAWIKDDFDLSDKEMEKIFG